MAQIAPVGTIDPSRLGAARADYNRNVASQPHLKIPGRFGGGTSAKDPFYQSTRDANSDGVADTRYNPWVGQANNEPGNAYYGFNSEGKRVATHEIVPDYHYNKGIESMETTAKILGNLSKKGFQRQKDIYKDAIEGLA